MKELLVKILALNDVKTFLKLNPQDFSDTSEYKKIADYYKKYKKLPPMKTFSLEEPPDCLEYYMDKHIEAVRKHQFGSLLAKAASIAGHDIEAAMSLIRKFKIPYDENNNLNSIVASYIDDTDKRFNDFYDNIIPTMWEGLNNLFFGYRQGDLFVFAARPKMGKSQLLFLQSYHAYKNNKKVLFISMEMSEQHFLERFISIVGRINPYHVARGMISSNKRAIIKEALSSDKFVFKSGGLRTNIETVESLIEINNPDIVFIDGAYLITSGKRYYQRWELIADVTENLKLISMECKVPIILSYQFTRESLKKKKFGIEDIQYSDVIGQVASIIIGIRRLDLKRLELSVLGSRLGVTGSIVINWDWENLNFSQIEYYSEGDFTYEA